MQNDIGTHYTSRLRIERQLGAEEEIAWLIGNPDLHVAGGEGDPDGGKPSSIDREKLAAHILSRVLSSFAPAMGEDPSTFHEVLAPVRTMISETLGSLYERGRRFPHKEDCAQAGRELLLSILRVVRPDLLTVPPPVLDSTLAALLGSAITPLPDIATTLLAISFTQRLKRWERSITLFGMNRNFACSIFVWASATEQTLAEWGYRVPGRRASVAVRLMTIEDEEYRPLHVVPAIGDHFLTFEGIFTRDDLIRRWSEIASPLHVVPYRPARLQRFGFSLDQQVSRTLARSVAERLGPLPLKGCWNPAHL